MLYLGPKNPLWMVAAIELVPHQEVAELRKSLQRIFRKEEVAEDISRLEICGSLAFGCSRNYSDVDICLAATTEIAQLKIYRFMETNRARIRSSIDELGNRMRLRLDVGYNNHDNRDYNVLFSLNDGKLIGRKPGNLMRESRRWDQASRKWLPKPFREILENVPGPTLEKFPIDA